MSDADWKKRLGIPINFSPGEDEEIASVQLRKKVFQSQPQQIVELNDRVPGESSTDDILHMYDQYGSTPPRTRIKNKNKTWDQKQKAETPTKTSRGRLARSRVNRRNTMDCALLNQMFIEDEETKKNDKRALHLLRESERDMKMSSSNVIVTANGSKARHSFGPDERADSMPIGSFLSTNNLIPNTTLIESSNCFMSVQSRPVGCRMSAPPTSFAVTAVSKMNERKTTEPVFQNRQQFHEVFSNLIKLGSVDKQDKNCRRTISREEYQWQTELKDLIWLELQAWHADRTPEQQDKYLLAARQDVGPLLKQIMEYRFNPSFSRMNSLEQLGNISPQICSDTDSGILTQESNSSSGVGSVSGTQSPCLGCISMYCRHCLEQQTLALKQIEVLLTKLEAAESLYPSTQAFGQHYPLYKGASFVGRVKAMCLWYNITRHHRLKLMIVGKILARLQGKQFKWPVNTSTNPSESSASSSVSGQDNGDDSGRDTIDTISDTNSSNNKVPKVQFDLEPADSDNPSDSASSTDSMKDAMFDDPVRSFEPVVGEYGKLINGVNIYNVHPLAEATFCNTHHSSTSPYRKYIENVLKSRGLGKSLHFLHRLHNVVLRKAHITLEKPGTEDIECESDVFDEDTPYMELPLEKEEVDELRRYGAWSTEAAELNLPSYVPAFLFLSLIPLEVIHEFLHMRLETKPLMPNPLSLEQLMKELREGLTLALIHRDRFNKHISTALHDKDEEMERYLRILNNFDTTLKGVLALYLEYVAQWVLVAAPEGHQKSALDDEWMFTKLVCPMIPEQHAIAAMKFCSIICSLLKKIGERLVSRSEELDSLTLHLNVNEYSADSVKWELLKICRETQSLFTSEREKSVKIMSFAKSLCRDIESVDFHREHCDEDDTVTRSPDEFVCNEVKQAVQMIKTDALQVRAKLTNIIERVTERCDVKYMLNMDEMDRISVLSRTREILHQGFKFGFEYHKDLSRLFEKNTASGRDSSCAMNLALGIIGFAKMWMQFVKERCERGRGLRPRWATQGFDFLQAACDPHNTQYLTDTQFEDMKLMMDACITHVIGSVAEPERIRASPRSRKSSPTPDRARTPTRSPNLTPNQKAFMPQFSLREEPVGMSPTSAPDSPDLIRKQTSCDNSITIIVPKINTYSPAMRQIRVRDSINRLDMDIENKLRSRNLIGQVKSLNICDKIHIRARSVTFRWHRGIKIGQGRFGKVYTAVNNSTGELMAMKEIPIQPGETRAIQNVAEELKIFEGISHKHLVKYYGIEIHREELLIFMELCSEGTLESLVELSGGLFEGITRRFTAQLLSAASELHKHGVVHRDIKTANIFLTNGGNCLKLGDFGSAVKIQTNTTVPGELQGYVGTQAYMAPEIFTKTDREGHGRAADIWSIGCVVVEMASGKRPWAQFDSNFQIMFKVGMGETPEAPASLSQEGHEFLEKCLQHDPKDRWTAHELLQHNFCKVGLEDDCACSTTSKEKEIRRSFRKGSKI